jgi:uncharacterized protein YfaS (alpha-2-macroglobulin family)
LTPHETVEVWVNGKSVGTRSFTAADLARPAAQIELEPFPGDARIKITRQGKGAVYFSARLTNYESATLKTGADNGLHITRTYQVRNAKGYWRDVEGAIPIGELVRVNVLIKAPQELHYVLLEDPAPAGFEARPEEDAGANSAEWHANCVLDKMVQTDPEPGWYPLPVTRRESRDDHQAFFLGTLFAGRTYFLRYVLRPEQAGTRLALPAHAAPTYHPAINGHSPANALEVK